MISKASIEINTKQEIIRKIYVKKTENGINTALKWFKILKNRVLMKKINTHDNYISINNYNSNNYNSNNNNSNNNENQITMKKSNVVHTVTTKRVVSNKEHKTTTNLNLNNNTNNINELGNIGNIGNAVNTNTGFLNKTSYEDNYNNFNTNYKKEDSKISYIEKTSEIGKNLNANTNNTNNHNHNSNYYTYNKQNNFNNTNQNTLNNINKNQIQNRNFDNKPTTTMNMVKQSKSDNLESLEKDINQLLTLKSKTRLAPKKNIY